MLTCDSRVSLLSPGWPDLRKEDPVVRFVTPDWRDRPRRLGLGGARLLGSVGTLTPTSVPLSCQKRMKKID